MNPEEVFETASLLIGDLAEKFAKPAENTLDVYLKSADDLVSAVAGLRVKRLGYLAAITGLDSCEDNDYLEVVYHFCTGEAIVNLRLRVAKPIARVPSLTEIIPSAEPYERELREMFGVDVDGLKNPDHLYLPDDWEEGIYPLRKDFPYLEQPLTS
jgi:NADH:ubiquinone oxidoreductase subunit C